MAILCLDFDGVLHQYDSPWVDEATISDGPVPGAIAFLLEAMQHFKVCIYSSRSKKPEGVRAMREWLYKHTPAVHWGELDALEFPVTKPPAFLTIDDRVLCFEGTWPDPKELLKFKPWNKRGK
jgi:hypothetical protein